MDIYHNRGASAKHVPSLKRRSGCEEWCEPTCLLPAGGHMTTNTATLNLTVRTALTQVLRLSN